MDLAHVQAVVFVCLIYKTCFFFSTRTKLPPLRRIVYLFVYSNRGKNDARASYQETGKKVKHVNKSRQVNEKGFLGKKRYKSERDFFFGCVAVSQIDGVFFAQKQH